MPQKTAAQTLPTPITLDALSHDLRQWSARLDNLARFQEEANHRTAVAYARSKAAARTRADALFTRNRAIMRLVRWGWTDRQIGEKFGLHPKHVNRVIARIRHDRRY